MSIVQQINEGLQALGFSQSLAAQLDQFIAFLGVLLVAYLADTVCRKILLKVVSRLVKQTKATWDDIVFDRKVMCILVVRWHAQCSRTSKSRHRAFLQEGYSFFKAV